MKEISDDNLQFLIDWARMWVVNSRDYLSYYWEYSEFFTIFALLLDEKLRRAEL